MADSAVILCFGDGDLFCIKKEKLVAVNIGTDKTDPPSFHLWDHFRGPNSHFHMADV
jgi:hypothetical protein